jgi:hypothetical protein
MFCESLRVGPHTVRAIKATQKHVAQVSVCAVTNSSIAFRFAAVLIDKVTAASEDLAVTVTLR